MQESVLLQCGAGEELRAKGAGLGGNLQPTVHGAMNKAAHTQGTHSALYMVEDGKE